MVVAFVAYDGLEFLVGSRMHGGERRGGNRTHSARSTSLSPLPFRLRGTRAFVVPGKISDSQDFKDVLGSGYMPSMDEDGRGGVPGVSEELKLLGKLIAGVMELSCFFARDNPGGQVRSVASTLRCLLWGGGMIRFGRRR